MGVTVFGKPKNDCSWGVQGDALPWRHFFLNIKHAKSVIDRVNIE